MNRDFPILKIRSNEDKTTSSTSYNADLKIMEMDILYETIHE